MSEKLSPEESDDSEKLGPLTDDWIGRHNIITRLITIVVIFIFMFSFLKPLDTGYAEIAAYLLVLIFITVTFGINSLKLIIELVKAWKK